MATLDLWWGTLVAQAQVKQKTCPFPSQREHITGYRGTIGASTNPNPTLSTTQTQFTEPVVQEERRSPPSWHRRARMDKPRAWPLGFHVPDHVHMVYPTSPELFLRSKSNCRTVRHGIRCRERCLGGRDRGATLRHCRSEDIQLPLLMSITKHHSLNKPKNQLSHKEPSKIRHRRHYRAAKAPQATDPVQQHTPQRQRAAGPGCPPPDLQTLRPLKQRVRRCPAGGRPRARPFPAPVTTQATAVFGTMETTQHLSSAAAGAGSRTAAACATTAHTHARTHARTHGSFVHVAG